jgi:hypothetical protein
MKKSTLFVLTVLFLSFSSYSQIYRNTFMVGGSLHFDNYKSGVSGNTNSSFSATPMVGYFFVDDFAGGIQMTFSNFSAYSATSLSPFIRYYWKNLFFQLRYDYTRSQLSGMSVASRSALGTDLGYAVFFNDNVAMEPSFYFTKGLASESGFSYGLKIGFQIYLNR